MMRAIKQWIKRLAPLILRRRKKYTLDDLLTGVTPEDFEGEMDWGDPVGKEIW
jgi:antitoxin MazE